MLETNEVDVDLFTPAPGTSLASIFSNMQVDENEENASLKYVPQAPIPPIQPNIAVTDMSKTSPTTQCVFATSVSAYEWVDNKYNLRENLGVALVKAAKGDVHHLIIYTSEKNTLSMATISSIFVVNVKKDVSISYYDNYKKYWLICASASKIANIVEHLENLKANVKHSTDEDITTEMLIEKDKNISKPHLKENLESDTDSSINRRNKHSLLRRMATMGQSVLPPNKSIAEQSTDSSDDNPPLPRHKPSKSLPKRYIVEKNVSAGGEILQNTLQIGEISSMPVKQDLVSNNIDNMNHVLDLESNHINMSSFISEQKINNSDLRININRLSDKVDQLFDKASFRGLETYSAANQQNEIVNKLLKEYETKILAYEKFIKSNGFDCNLIIANNIKLGDLETAKDNNTEMKDTSRKQDSEIKHLIMKRQEHTSSNSQTVEKYNEYEDTLLKEIDNLKLDLHNKNELLNKINDNIQILTNKSNINDYTNKLKKIMNGTFHTISTEFNDEDTYSGTIVKNVVAKIIKKTTLESLN